MQKLNILVAGSTGYIGTELIKLLVNHKNVKIKYLCGNTSIGKNISFYEKSLKYKKLPKYTFFKKTGPQHKPIFKTEVEIPLSKKIIGEGTSKKNAQQNAAAKLIKILNI